MATRYGSSRRFILLVLVVLLAVPVAVLAGSGEGEGDPAILATMRQWNQQLQRAGMNIAIEEIELFTIGEGRPSNRIHQAEFQWVPYDPRRQAQGSDITYLVDRSDGRTASGLSASQTEAAIDRALETWDAQDCLSTVELVKRADSGRDPDIADALTGFGQFGTVFLADIVNAGWLPPDFFEARLGPGAGTDVIAVAITFIFVDPTTREPTDIDGNNYLDRAFTEIYYNDSFGQRRTANENFPWGIDVTFPGIDVESVALHETGHALGLRHFGAPPEAVMNPFYDDIQQEPLAADLSGMCTIWSSWP